MDRFANPIRSLLLATDERAAHVAFDVAPMEVGPLMEGGLAPAPSMSTTPHVITTPPSATSDVFPEMIAYGDGFLAVWNRAQASGPTSVLAQKFDANGIAVGGVMTIEAAAIGVGGKAEMIELDGGKVAVFWQVGITLKGGILNPDTGAMTNVQTIVADVSDWMHDVIRLNNGDIAMVTSPSDGANGDIDILVLNDTNLSIVSQKTIDTFASTSNTYDHTICSLGAGGVAIFRDRDTNELFAQKFSATGAISGAPVQVNTHAISMPTLFDLTYFAPQATELSTGGYVVTWMNIEGSGGDRVEVRGRVFDASGAPIGGDFLVNPTPAGNQYDAQIIALDDGNFAVTWVSDVGFTRTSMIRYFDAQGHALTGEIATGTPSIFSTVVDHQTVVLADGTIVDLYPEGGFTALTVDGIYQPQFGTAGADSLTGTAGDDVILAGSGDDKINLRNGGNDLANGQDGNDIIDLGAAYTTQDSIDGGAGSDTVILNGDYSLTFGPAFAGIEKIQVTHGHDYLLVLTDAMTPAGKTLTIDGSDLAAGDTLFLSGDPEHDGKLAVTGGLGSDTLFGGTGDDVLNGGGGADLIAIQFGGDDAVQGGDGNDTIAAGSALTGSDKINGGAGVDVLQISGNSNIVLKAKAVTNVEVISLANGFSYSLVMDNGNLDAGKTLTIDASALTFPSSLSFDGRDEANGAYVVNGGAGNDTLRGGGGADRLTSGAGDNTLDISAGGKDIATGGANNDTILGGGALDVKDKVDGGGGFDTLALDGNYAAGLHLKAATFKNIETISLAVGHDYKLFLDDGNVAAGAQLTVDGLFLGAGDTLYFDGSGEHDGTFNLFSGGGNDTLFGGTGNDGFTTGGGNDVIDLTRGGNDQVSGGEGDDLFKFLGTFTADDHVNGGGGVDTVLLDGNYSALLSFNALTMDEVERIELAGDHDYNLAVFTPQNQTVTVDGSDLGAGDAMSVTKLSGGGFSHIVLVGGAGADTLQGGDGADTIKGGGGADILGGGNTGQGDTFVYTALTDSKNSARDIIVDLDGSDVIDLSAIDANSLVAGDQAFVNVGAAFTGHAGELRIFLQGSDTLIQLDVNGDGAADATIQVTGEHLFNNFVL